MEIETLQSPVLAVGAMILGIGLLIKGGDWTVDSSVYVARRFEISPLLVGFTIVAFGTSLPELVTSILANFEGSPGIALGNVLGSNIANVLLVLGVVSIFTTLTVVSRAIVKDLLIMLVSTCILAVLLLYGGVARWAGLGMVVMLIVYIFSQYKMAQGGEMPSPENGAPEFSSLSKASCFLLAGLFVVALGAQFLVHGARESASILGIPEAFIALTVIAVGTSLPELSTSLIAARKGHSDMVLGNIIGSNVFNILMIIGLTALLKPILQGSFAHQLVDFDIWIVGLVSLVFALLLIFYGKVTKPIGIAFVAAYFLYNAYIYTIYIGS